MLQRVHFECRLKGGRDCAILHARTRYATKIGVRTKIALQNDGYEIGLRHFVAEPVLEQVFALGYFYN